VFPVSLSHPARNCPLRRGRTFQGGHLAAFSPFQARQSRETIKIDQRVHAIAADPRSSEAMDPRSSEAINESHERAKANNASINQRLWKERLGHRGTSSVVSREEALGTYQWAPGSGYKGKYALWQTMIQEARRAAEEEPVLASFFHMTVIMHSSLEKSLAFLLANKLSNTTLLSVQLTRLILDAYRDDPGLAEACVADLNAVFDRDPACETYLHGFCFFKGFQAIQVQRIAHWMWKNDRKSLAVALQSRMSEVFDVDIHPGATLGKGLMIDHASGVVIGETAVIGDNVSLLHHVTLGGSGTGTGMRHPTIGNGVLIGAGASVLGPVVLGANSKVGAGSVVVTDLPSHCVAVGVPARVVKRLDDSNVPSKDMDQIYDLVLEYII
jgi:serine O-acetyltransferase